MGTAMVPFAPPATAAEIIKQAKALLSDPKKWIKGTYARNRLGASKLGWESGAVAFCTLGALQNITGHQPYGTPAGLKATDYIVHAAKRLFPGNSRSIYSIPGFNDDLRTTHEDLMQVLDKAELMARSGE